jgi:hypothetical protein
MCEFTKFGISSSTMYHPFSATVKMQKRKTLGKKEEREAELTFFPSIAGFKLISVNCV